MKTRHVNIYIYCTPWRIILCGFWKILNLHYTVGLYYWNNTFGKLSRHSAFPTARAFISQLTHGKAATSLQCTCDKYLVVAKQLHKQERTTEERQGIVMSAHLVTLPNDFYSRKCKKKNTCYGIAIYWGNKKKS